MRPQSNQSVAGRTLAPAVSVQPLRPAEAADERAHAQIVAEELLAELLPLRPVMVSINRFGTGFCGHFGVELPMPTVANDLSEVQAVFGGTLIVSAETTSGGAPYLRHTLTGHRAGVAFEVWTTVHHPRPRPAVAS